MTVVPPTWDGIQICSLTQILLGLVIWLWEERVCQETLLRAAIVLRVSPLATTYVWSAEEQEACANTPSSEGPKALPNQVRPSTNATMMWPVTILARRCCRRYCRMFVCECFFTLSFPQFYSFWRVRTSNIVCVWSV